MEYVHYKKGCFVEFDENIFDRICKELSMGEMNITGFDDGYVEGRVDCNEDCVLFTSIPYEKGWRAYVDGEKVKVEAIVDDTFCGLNLVGGNHGIIFKYVPPGRTGGFVITTLSIFFTIAELFIAKANERKLPNV
jgi:uncharacterized membrane protein YfhO